MTSTVNRFKQAETQLEAKDYKSEVKPIWCAGCGYHGILNSMYKALAELNIDPSQIINISGIGCSSRTPYFVNSYKMHTLHGRAAPVATGAQLVNPDLPVIITGGDGDGFSIGGGHMPHLARKNLNITYILMDNHIYGLTKGQVSPTSRREMKAYTTPYGGVDDPLNPVKYLMGYEASFVAQAYAGQPAVCKDLIRQAIEHKGFSYVNILSPCPTFNKIDTLQYYKELVKNIPENHDSSNYQETLNLINSYETEGKAPIGLLFKDTTRETLDKRMADLVKLVGGSSDYDLNKIVDLAK
ncbi:MAG: 2-oxoacid:ferredoxin oxidoreductase subunit beta, partial [Gammaproteobacteria bacterium]